MFRFGKSHNIGLLVLFGIFYFGLCVHAVEPELTPLGEIQWGAEIDGMRLGVSTSKDYTYARTHRFFVDVVLQNNKQDWVIRERNGKVFDYVFTVTDAQGKAVPLTEKGTIAVANRDTEKTFEHHFATLKLGESTLCRFNVEYYYDLTRSGPFTVSAVQFSPLTLRDKSEIAKGLASGKVVFGFKSEDIASSATTKVYYPFEDLEKVVLAMETKNAQIRKAYLVAKDGSKEFVEARRATATKWLEQLKVLVDNGVPAENARPEMPAVGPVPSSLAGDDESYRKQYDQQVADYEHARELLSLWSLRKVISANISAPYANYPLNDDELRSLAQEVLHDNVIAEALVKQAGVFRDERIGKIGTKASPSKN